jgi:uncharacterized protein YpmB
MKKLLIIIGSFLIMACVVVLFVNATGSKKESQKAKTETCDPATCPGHMEGAQKESPACSQTISCTGICGSKTTGAK